MEFTIKDLADNEFEHFLAKLKAFTNNFKPLTIDNHILHKHQYLQVSTSNFFMMFGSTLRLFRGEWVWCFDVTQISITPSRQGYFFRLLEFLRSQNIGYQYLRIECANTPAIQSFIKKYTSHFTFATENGCDWFTPVLS